MEQLFPTPVDDVDVHGIYASDDRPTFSNRPWVMGNMISSIDGAIEIDGVSGGLGGDADKAVFSAIRALPDIIVVASGTVIAENYRRPQTPGPVQELRVARGQAPLPRIAIVTGSLSINADHRVFDPESRPLIITHSEAPAHRREALAPVADILDAGGKHVDLHVGLRQLHELGANVVLLEGGPTLNGAFVAEDLIDELCLSFSPMLVGGTGPRIVAARHTSTPDSEDAASSEDTASLENAPRPMRLGRTLHQDGFLFHRYLRDR